MQELESNVVMKGSYSINYVWVHKGVDMSYTLIIIVIAGILAIVLAFLLVNNNDRNVEPLHIGSDLKGIREIMTTDAHLHRLLMIEIIQDKELENKERSLPSESVTFNKMSNGMDNLNKVLVKSFGSTIAQRIATLMQRRNEIIREYYWSLRTMTCDTGECVLGTEDKIIPVFPSASLLDHQQSILDITTLTERKLQSIAREITDQVTASFNIKDVKSPIIHFQRLFNLIAMYDKELINQAKSYVTKQYTISMNCAQSSLDISNHISDEFGVLMHQERSKPNP